MRIEELSAPILFDIGCGPPAEFLGDGLFLNYMGTGMGMDNEKRSIRFPFLIGDITNISIKEKQFNIVSALEVIEHIDKPEQALKEVSRILKNDGVFIITTPNNNIIWKAVWFFLEKIIKVMWHDTHVTNFNKMEWIRFIRDSGLFEIEEVKTMWFIDILIKMRKK